MKRIFTVLLAVLILCLYHPATAGAAFEPAEQKIIDPPLDSKAPQISNDDTKGRNILESVIQWGSEMVHGFASRNDLAGAAVDEETMTDTCKTVIDFLGCDYELYRYGENADKLIARFADLTEQGKAAGFCPLIVIPSGTLVEKLHWIFTLEGVENTAEGIAAYRQKIVDKAQEVDAKGLLSEGLDEYMESLEKYDIDMLGEFVPFTSEGRILLYMTLYGPYQEVVIAKIPTENPWELAAWVPMGGFNACPMPEEQVAVFRYWHESYGAAPAVVTHDIWEMTVTNPPETDEEAEALAMEQFAFCEDIVFQGTDTIRVLASILKNGATWYFWWD